MCAPLDIDFPKKKTALVFCHVKGPLRCGVWGVDYVKTRQQISCDGQRGWVEFQLLSSLFSLAKEEKWNFRD